MKVKEAINILKKCHPETIVYLEKEILKENSEMGYTYLGKLLKIEHDKTQDNDGFEAVTLIG